MRPLRLALALCLGVFVSLACAACRVRSDKRRSANAPASAVRRLVAGELAGLRARAPFVVDFLVLAAPFVSRAKTMSTTASTMGSMLSGISDGFLVLFV